MKFRVFLSDCGINKSILPQIGLTQEFCHIFWYHWHLEVKNWPDSSGVRVYQTHLREHMVQMCKAVGVNAFDFKNEEVKAVFANKPAPLEYLCEFHDHPKQFTQYNINEVEG